jgi:hypothetical protein
MKTITYSLKKEEKNSEQYYNDVSTLTDLILIEAEEHIEPIAEAFQFYLIKTKGEILRSKSEYIFELLTLGTLIRIYERHAVSLPFLPQRILVLLASIRQKYLWSKSLVDLLRGVLITLFLTKNSETIFSKSRFGVEKIEKLLEWLAAAGDFKQEVKRIKVWKGFLSSLPMEKAFEYIFTAMDFAKWFGRESKKILGAYTKNVNKFLEYEHYKYKWREDIIFCGRQQVEYHLNMVGAVIMNRAWRDEFLSTKKKVVLVPACMRSKSGSHCKWEFNGMDYSCTGCTDGCKVNKLKKIGEKEGFGVVMVPHSTDFTKWLVKRSGNKEVGIVGVTCALNLMTGGWEAKGLGIPINCVLLDYCGCKNHWDEKGFPTGININELRRVLNLNTNIKNNPYTFKEKPENIYNLFRNGISCN